jgi:preprotein translocase subunit YajC
MMNFGLTPFSLMLAQDGDTPVSSDAPASAPPAGGDATPAAPSTGGGANPETSTGAGEGSGTVQDPVRSNGGPGPTGGDPGFLGGMGPMLLIMLLIFVVLIILPGRARKKQAAKFEDMYKGLKRDDRIMLQNGKFVTIERVEKDRVFVYGDKDRRNVEEYHRNAVAMLAKDVTQDSAKKEGT